MAFWLAALNPGGKTRRRARKAGRRKLSAWQRMVKKHGGVMQAVRARKGARRNGVLPTAFNAPRTVGARRSRRGRSRARLGGRFVMARVKSRRRTHRVSRSSRRGVRRNTWSDDAKGHRRASRLGWRRRRHGRRAKRNSWFGAIRRHRRAARLGHRRRSRQSYRRNAVVPVAWNPGLYPNPRHRRKSRRSRRHSSNPRRHRRSRRGLARQNSSAVLPFSLNPGKAIKGLTARVGSFVNVSFWLEEAIPAAGGFLGTKLVGAMIHGAISKQVGTTGLADKVLHIASDALAASGLAWVVGELGQKVVGRKSKKIADRVFFGGVVGIAYSVLKELLGGTDVGRVLGLQGLGDDLADRMKNEVQRRVEAEMSGMGAYLTQNDLQLQGLGTYMTQDDLTQQSVGEFVTDAGLRGQSGYSALPTGSLSEYSPSDETLRL